MPRKPRIHYPGALFHVICRGNNREWIFQGDREKKKYKGLIKQYKNRYGFKLYSWVILSNHAHLLIEVGDVSLSKTMQGIQQTYTQWYNRIYDRTGHVFEQRYKAIHCNKDMYLLSLIRYIHQNPVRAKMKEGFEYPWSSYRDYVEINTGGLTDIHFPLSLFSTDPSVALENFLVFMGIEEKTIGTLKPGELEMGTPGKSPLVAEKKVLRKSLCELTAAVAAFYGIKPSDLVGNSKKRKLTAARSTLLLLVEEHTDFTRREIANELGINVTTVSKIISKAKIDTAERDRIKKIIECQISSLTP